MWGGGEEEKKKKEKKEIKLKNVVCKHIHRPDI